MSTARFADAAAALRAAFGAAPGLAGVTLASGPVPAATSRTDFLITGHDGTLRPDGSLAPVSSAGRFTQAPVIMGGPPVKEETGTINCAAVSQSGDPADIPGRLARVQVILAACEDACLDLKSGGIVFDATGGGDVHVLQMPDGCAVVLAFTVGYTAPW